MSTTPATTTAPAPAPAPAPAAPEVMPSAATLQHAARLSLQNDKPIQLDYYVETHLGKAFLGEDVDTKERVLVKSKDEFTSTIQKTFKVGEDFLIMTENTIYIVSGKITKKRISMASLIGDL